MRLVDLVHSAVPVVSHREERVRLPAPKPAPAIGRRWGRQATFSFSLEEYSKEDQGPGISVRLPEDEPAEYMRVMEADLKVRAKLVTIVDPNDPNSYVDVDRLEQMYFHYTTFPPKPTRSSLQPSLTTYYNLKFNLHPPTTEEKAK